MVESLHVRFVGAYNRRALCVVIVFFERAASFKSVNFLSWAYRLTCHSTLS